MVYRIFGGVIPPEDSGEMRDLRSYSQFKNLDGNIKELHLVDSTQDDGKLIIPGDPMMGRALRPDNIPTKLNRIPTSLEELPLLDMEQYLGGNLLVPLVFKELLEELEPDVHQFWPMDIYVNGELADRKYWFIACNRIAALSREHCYPPLNDRGFWRPSPIGQRQNDQVVFESTAIGGCHAWVDNHFADRMFSDIFAKRLMERRLTGIDFSYIREV